MMNNSNTGKGKKNNKINILLAVVLIAGLIFIWLGNGEDYYKNYITYDKFDYIADFEKVDDGIKITEKTGKKGVVSQYPEISLEKGTYNVEVNYKVNSNGSYLYLGGLNKKIPLDKNKTQKIITIKSDKTINSLGLKIYYSGNGDLEFQGVYIGSQDKVCNDTYFYMFLYITFILLCFYYANNKEKAYKFLSRKSLSEDGEKGLSNLFIIAILLGTIIFISYPLFGDYIRAGHDVSFQMNRIEGIASGLMSGQFPVRIHASTLGGYGHAASIYYPELFLYIPAVFRVLGLSAVLSYNIFAVMINAATVLIMYFAVYKILKDRNIALISSIIYGTSIYRLSNLYFRFALGEVLAMVFLPLMIYALYELFFGESRKWWLLAVAYTLVLQTHIISIFITTAFCILFGLIFIYKLKDKSRLLGLLKAIGMVVLLNLWFLLPFLQFYTGVELNTGSLTAYMHDNTVYISQLFEVYAQAKGYNLGLGNTIGEMPFTTGIVIMIFAFAFIYFMFIKKKVLESETDHKNYKIAVVIFIFGILSLFLATTLFPWYQVQNILPITGMIQFPWRFIGFGAAFLSISGATAFYYLKRNHSTVKTALISLLIVCIITSGYFLGSLNENDVYIKHNEAVSTFESYWNIDNSDYVAYRPFLVKVDDGSYKYGGLSIGGGEYLYEGTDISKFKNMSDIVTLSNKKAKIKDYNKSGTNIQLTYISSSRGEEYIEVPLLYYPGYEAVSAGKTLETSKGNNNILRVNVTGLKNADISIRYKGYPLWRVADIISLFALAGLIVIYIRQKRNIKKT